MYKHILIATDGSELAGKALLHGLDLAKALNAKVTLMTASEPMWSAMPGEMAIAFPHEDYERAMVENAKRILATVSDAATTRQLYFNVKHVRDQFPAEAIVEAAREGGCDLIVMASHGRRGIAQLVLGSQASKVLTLSTVSVLIYRE